MKTTLRAILLAVLIGNTEFSSAFAHGSHMGFDDLLIGKAGDPAQVTHTVTISMLDEAGFAPSTLTVEKNETIHFVITNKGKARHEFMLGTARRLREHNALLKSDPQMKTDVPYRISLAPGATGDIFWKFNLTGTVGFACFEPGHFDAGMLGEIVVTAPAEDNPASTPVR